MDELTFFEEVHDYKFSEKVAEILSGIGDTEIKFKRRFWEAFPLFLKDF